MNLLAFSKAKVEKLLLSADIVINGPRPSDMQVHDQKLYSALLLDSELALGETYMAGMWECEALDEFFYKLLRADTENKMLRNIFYLPSWFHFQARDLLAIIFNQQTKTRSKRLGTHAYDIGNDFFKLMLDSRLNYTCAYFDKADTLEEAQAAKLELICKKLYLRPGMRVLDIGCGWGSFARYAAENYKVEVVGITISQEQCKFAQEYCQGLPVNIRMQDYRDVQEQFDRIVSIGMFEHVGQRNYSRYMRVASQCLAQDGLFLLHTIGGNVSIHHANAWIQKYIFPNGAIPSASQITKAYERLLVMEDWHNMGVNYDKTLMAWYHNFANHWTEIKKSRSEQFYRMWRFYLLSCAGAFRARDLQLWQIVFSKGGMVDGYRTYR